MLKKLVTGCLLLVPFVACSGDNVAGGTIDPNTIAENSSSSVIDMVESSSSCQPYLPISSSSELKNVGESSSSMIENEKVVSSSSEKDRGADEPLTPPSSSSEKAGKSSDSLDNDGGSGHFINNPTSSSSITARNEALTAKNFKLECSVDVVDVSSDVLAPYASKSVEGDSVNILISDYFKIPCDKNEAETFVNDVNALEAVNLGIVGDTLHVGVARNVDVTYGCQCVANVNFTLDAEFSSLKYASLEQRKSTPLEERE